jgi:dihydropteroate synthase
MAAENLQLELHVAPISPDTVSSVRAELTDAIVSAAEKAELRDASTIRVHLEQTFPGAEIVVAVVSGIALETFKATILPLLKGKFDAHVKERRDHKTQ